MKELERKENVDNMVDVLTKYQKLKNTLPTTSKPPPAINMLCNSNQQITNAGTSSILFSYKPIG